MTLMHESPTILDPLLRRYLTSFKKSQVPHRFTDVLVLGTGVAGLSAALAASEDPAVEVLVVAKDKPEETATQYAQGGVVAVLEPERTCDSLEQHLQDTLEVAAGIGDAEAIALLTTDGVARVRELIRLGAAFDRDPAGRLHFTLEGGHTFPRILHKGDTTGREIQLVLERAVGARTNTTVLHHTFAVDLVTSDGAVSGALLSRPDGALEVAWARRTVLATGGAGRLYRETTNPQVSTADGLAMAFRAGAVLRDLEFMQFHPTTLYLAGADRFLITEAVRGEGGVLRDGSGERFMHKFHPLGDLAPRDVVSLGIVRTLRERGENVVHLDLSAIPPEKIMKRFPRILEILRGFGIDILREPIPVRPSAHYMIGGVKTDLLGHTSLPGLFAAGEAASTGVHGANRLASNSLLEGLVFGHRAGLEAARESHASPPPQPFSIAPESHPAASARAALDLDDLSTSLRSLLWQRVGIERSAPELLAAQRQIRSWIPYVLGSDFRDRRSWTVQNMLLVAYLMTSAAIRREESRGVHYRVDFPARDDEHWRRHLQVSKAELGIA